MSEAVRTAIAGLVDQKDLTTEQIEAAFAAILAGESTDALTSALLVALRVRGETPADIVAGAKAMRANARRVDAPPDVVDTCGTGGLSWTSLNTSTAAAIVAAGTGAVVAKHGNRSTPPKTGSADVLEALGVNLTPSDDQISQCFKDAGLMFMFAPAHHGAMKHVAPVRRALGIRTIFNLLGPLTNPAGARRQLLGVFSEQWLEPMAKALLELGAEKAWVVHGVGGMDEISTFGPTKVVEVSGGQLRSFALHPDEFKMPLAQQDDLRGGSVEHNRDALLDVLSGKQSAFADLVTVNAAGALVVSGLASNLGTGIEMARGAIDDGRAMHCLEALKRASHG